MAETIDDVTEVMLDIEDGTEEVESNEEEFVEVVFDTASPKKCRLCNAKYYINTFFLEQNYATIVCNVFIQII